MTIDEMYNRKCEKRSDIFKHLPDLNPCWKIDLVKRNNNGFIVLIRG